MLTAPPLGLYVHLPWCVSKCPYCDFNSHGLRGELPWRRYTEAVVRDLERAARGLEDRVISTVFFGGGTPSLFPAECIAQVLSSAAGCMSMAPDAEVTLEANPGALELGNLAAFRDAGVNRVSLGVQSFDPEALATLGRVHGPGEARAAAAAVSAAGLERLNLDLMYGLPGQTCAGATADLRAALELAPEHLSHYQLTLEPNTLFYARPPALPDDDAVAAMQERTAAELESAGYRRYEVSAWSLPGAECRHNLNYWRYGDYLAVGAGAHGKITWPAAGRIERDQRLRHPEAYMAARDPVASRSEVTGDNRSFEFMLNALRLVEGFDAGLFEGRTGLPVRSLAPALDVALQRGLLAPRGDSGWRPTPRGLQFLNDLQILFLPEASLP
jgi:oxygen-independent coproporphyrinogen-3 oxidase